MPRSTTRITGSEVNTIDASALESLEAINHRLKDGGNCPAFAGHRRRAVRKDLHFAGRLRTCAAGQ